MHYLHYLCIEFTKRGKIWLLATTIKNAKTAISYIFNLWLLVWQSAKFLSLIFLYNN